MADFPPAIVEAARFERDRRAERYPVLVRGNRLGEEEATVDYQCWCAIAAWFESGQFRTIEGGVDGLTVVDWALAEAATERALARITAKCDKLLAGSEAASAKCAAACARRANLVVIHRTVQLRRQSIEAINAELRGKREQIAA